MQVQAQFTPRFVDLFRADYMVRSSITKSVLYFILIFVMGLVFGSLAFVTSPGALRRDWQLPAMLSCAAPIIAVAIMGVRPALVSVVQAAMAQGGKDTPSPMLWTFDDTGAILVAAGVETRMEWAAFRSAKRIGDDYILVRAGTVLGKFDVIPKRAFPTASDEAEFRRIVSDKIGSLTDESRHKRFVVPLVTAALVAGIMALCLLQWAVIAWRTQ